MGIPVRNGEPLLPRAIDSILTQDYANLEVIVSNNCSTDSTAQILDQYAQQDSRVRILTQRQPLSAFDNFLEVLSASRGEYFMWAAHDDTRSDSFVRNLVSSLTSNRNAVLAFGVLQVEDAETLAIEAVDFDFETVGKSKLGRMWKASQGQCFHFYGVWRADTLRSLSFNFSSWWPDLPILEAAAGLGEFEFNASANFTYHQAVKSAHERVLNQDYSTAFSYPKAIASLIQATWRTCRSQGGLADTVAGITFVGASQGRKAIPHLLRRLIPGAIQK